VKKTKKPDCMACGLCCVATSTQEAFCDLDDADLETLADALGDRWIRRNVMFASTFDMLARRFDGGGQGADMAIKTKILPINSGPLKGCESCACVALKGVPMKKVSCSIYENRPRACQTAVNPGDRTCLEIRRLYQDFVDRENEGVA